ncbi:uncharacterized protein [Watersipora subatra]|uniref:uncharacterized protein n=1 Tax=Watersipora subatra TaxID=2589382 RepID=UPI00355C7D34
MADIKDYGKAATDLHQNETYNQVSQPPNHGQSEAYAAQRSLHTGQQATLPPGQQGAPHPRQQGTPYPTQQTSPYHGQKAPQYPEQLTGNPLNSHLEQPATSYSKQQQAQHPEKQAGVFASQYAQYQASGQPLQPSYQVVQRKLIKSDMAWSVIICLFWYCLPGVTAIIMPWRCGYLLLLIAIIMSAMALRENGRGNIEKAWSYRQWAFLVSALSAVMYFVPNGYFMSIYLLLYLIECILS